MTHPNQILGGYGECVATRHLLERGMAVLDRNWRGSAGEVDVVARDGASLVFVEVKTRRSTRFGAPVESIVPAKARRMRRVAAQWLASARLRPSEVRFDVISVLQTAGGTRVEHLRGAF